MEKKVTTVLCFKNNRFYFDKIEYDAEDSIKYADIIANDSTYVLHDTVMTSFNGSNSYITKHSHEFWVDGMNIRIEKLITDNSSVLDGNYLIELADRVYILGTSMYADFHGSWHLGYLRRDDFIGTLNLILTRGIKYVCEKYIEILNEQLSTLQRTLEEISKVTDSYSIKERDSFKRVNVYEETFRVHEIASKILELSERKSGICKWLLLNYPK